MERLHVKSENYWIRMEKEIQMRKALVYGGFDKMQTRIVTLASLLELVAKP